MIATYNYACQGNCDCRTKSWKRFQTLVIAALTLAPLSFSIAQEETSASDAAIFQNEDQTPAAMTNSEVSTAVQNARELFRNLETGAHGAISRSKTRDAEVSRKAPWISDLVDVDLFTGLYEFDEGPEDDVQGMKEGMNDVAMSNRMLFEASYFEEEDVDDRGVDGFFGFWASIPIGEDPNDKDEAGQAEDNGLWSALTRSNTFSRLRTRRQREAEEVEPAVIVAAEPEKEEPRPKFFERVFRRNRAEKESPKVGQPSTREKARKLFGNLFRRRG